MIYKIVNHQADDYLHDVVSPCVSDTNNNRVWRLTPLYFSSGIYLLKYNE
jgi:hypothetical protein